MVSCLQVSTLKDVLRVIGVFNPTTQSMFKLKVSVESDLENDLSELQQLLQSILAIKSLKISLKLSILLHTSADIVDQQTIAHLGEISGLLRSIGSPPPCFYEADPPFRSLLAKVVTTRPLDFCHHFLDHGICLEVADYPCDGKSEPSEQRTGEVICKFDGKLQYRVSQEAQPCSKQGCPTRKLEFHECVVCGWRLCTDCYKKEEEHLQNQIKEAREKELANVDANENSMDDRGKEKKPVKSRTEDTTLLGLVIKVATDNQLSQPNKMLRDLCSAIMKSPLAPANMALGIITALQDKGCLKLLLGMMDPNVEVYLPRDLIMKRCTPEVTKKSNGNSNQELKGLPLHERVRPLLHVALWLDYPEAVDILIDNNADLHATDWKDRPFLQLLVKKAGGPDRRRQEPAQDSSKDWRLQLIEKHKDVFRADVNRRCGISYATPLHWACRNGNLQLARLLLDMRAAVDAKDCHEQTPLFSVIHAPQQDDSKEILHLLTEPHDTDFKLKDDQDTSILHECARNCNVLLFGELLRRLDKQCAEDLRNSGKESIAICACNSNESNDRIATFLSEAECELNGVMKFLLQNKQWGVLEALADLETCFDPTKLENQSTLQTSLLKLIQEGTFKGAHSLGKLMIRGGISLKEIRDEDTNNGTIIHVTVAKNTNAKKMLHCLRHILPSDDWCHLLEAEYDNNGKLPQHVAIGNNYRVLQQLGARPNAETTGQNGGKTWLDLKLELLPEQLEHYDNWQQQKKLVPTSKVLHRFKMLTVIVLPHTSQGEWRTKFLSWHSCIQKRVQESNGQEPCELLVLRRNDGLCHFQSFPGYQIPSSHWFNPSNQESLKKLIPEFSWFWGEVAILDSEWVQVPGDFMQEIFRNKDWRPKGIEWDDDDQ